MSEGEGSADHVVKVVVVDDDALVRAALTLMLDGIDGLRVVGEAADGAGVAAVVDRHAPHVVLMDLRMPQVDGVTATRRLRARPNAPEVVVLTTFDADSDVLAALHAGASGFLLKDTPPPQIVEAIHRVASGEPCLSPTITRRLMQATVAGTDARQRARAALSGLTARESDVAVAVGGGQSNAEIAQSLLMSVATVKAHVSSILAKLDLANRTALALLVHEADLVP